MRRKAILLVICFTVGAGVTVWFGRNLEPRYQGSSLSKWLAIYSDDAQDFQGSEEAAQAIRRIGTNALPFLIKWIRYEPPSWQETARGNLPGFVTDNAPGRFLFGDPGNDTADRAVLGFCLLGTNATMAIPELRRLMKDRTHGKTSLRAISALSMLGAPGFPHMVAALSDTNQPYRDGVAVCLAWYMAPAVGTNTCLPPLIAALNDPNPQVRSAASRMLMRLTAKSPP